MENENFEIEHQKALHNLKRNIPSDGDLEAMVNIFKAFGDMTRVKIILALSKTPLSVGEIADTLDMSQSSISHQLSILKQLNLVSNARRGRNIHYRLSDQHIITIFNQTKEHIIEDENEY
ncbi:ArsR/SmtB family transcription factor [Companilactobacillus versmoldensis]|uniref:Transcription regulator n=1 Tax=Companilactobacillus versmoldensis DSM 14857 = KCTC 3814 TaxID=1423815 RepID=A0A0R1SCE2_9LACO|nr:metalloregulator ArsR/SmtB family transcription factor [Companilactobacillus versmoldensis]KRL66668.1 transcription regulator [Companilactobacillus versmoldensis DSM 14857 = KCTC 3814]